ncbi:MAG: hypothetical protein HQK51_03175 [Oligoflexia bacterium]|nr:hypothetical protein [Oligoflexia bacterium]
MYIVCYSFKKVIGLLLILFCFLLIYSANSNAHQLFKKEPASINDDIWSITNFPYPLFNNKSVSLFSPNSNNKLTSIVTVEKNYKGGWNLLVDGEPFVVKAVSYSPTKIGLSPDTLPGAQTDWMKRDDNGNGKCDAAYDTWVDSNNNNIKDPSEKTVGDFALMKEMGVNAIRLYSSISKASYVAEEFNKNVLRDLYYSYGIRVIMGNFFGAYTIGSDAPWSQGTDYTDPIQREKMLEYVRDQVMDHKDEPYVLMWLLGNENEFPGTNSNAGVYLRQYITFLNEAAKLIHQLDPNHPVAISSWGDYGNRDRLFKYYSELAPDIDIFGINVYHGNTFGNIWKEITKYIDKPIFVAEYGADAFAAKGNQRLDFQGEEDQTAQSEYHRGNWMDIVKHSVEVNESGPAIGGCAFEWSDEWWKQQKVNESFIHNSRMPWGAPFPDELGHEEWFGLVGLNSGKNQVYDDLQRNLREVYFLYKDELWKKK